MVVGAVEILPPSGEEIVVGEDGDTAVILAGSRLTTGRGSRAAFVLAGGGSLRMDVDSEVVVETPARLFLHRGGVYLDSDDEEGPQTEVRTVFGTAREVGTQFEVRRSLDELVVRVREGLVEVVRGSVEYEVSLGAMLRLAADGSHTVATIATYGDEWDWVQSVAPVFEIEGRTAAQLLDWVSRETGLWVSYASLEVEEEAHRTVLHGSIEGVAPAQAPALVLPGCGLRAEFGAGTLTVDLEP